MTVTLQCHPSYQKLKADFEISRDSADIDGACLAWCSALDQRSLKRDFGTDSFITYGLTFARDRYSEIKSSELAAKVAVHIYALLLIVDPGTVDSDDWAKKAFDATVSYECNETCLSFGITAAAWVYWHGKPYSQFSKWLEVLDKIAKAKESGDLLTIAWIAARLHCELVYADNAAMKSIAAMLSQITQRIDEANIDTDETPVGSAALVHHLITGKLDEARAYFYRTISFVPRLAPYDAWVFSFYKTWMLIVAGDHESAMLEAGRGLVYARRSEVRHALAWAKFARARTMASLASAKGVWKYLAEARNEARQLQNPLLLALCRLASAIAALERGRRSRAVHLALAALAAIERAHMLRPPLLSSVDFGRLLRCLEPLANDAVDIPTLRALYAGEKSDFSFTRPSLLTQVEIRCLGTFTLRRSGRLLTWPRKAPKRPLDLLKAVIANGPNGTLVGDLVERIWPDLEGDRAHRAFTTTLFRLRQLLGEKTLSLSNGLLTLNNSLVWVDAFAFEEAVARSNNTLSDGATMLELYGGAFLANQPELTWSAPLRYKLRDHFRNAVHVIAENGLADGNWRNTLHFIDEALKRDPLAEHFYQSALTACLAGGLRADASTYYERCRAALSEHFGISPSSKTEGLYRSVLRAAR
jgi:LuxR family maltose regulon positive regulatory protein